MREPRSERHLTLEARNAVPARTLRQEDFHRRGSPEHRMLRPIHRPHPALAHELTEHVLSETLHAADLVM